MSSNSENIKLHIPGESFWGIKLSENTAEVNNILLNPEYGLGDIVKFNPEDGEVISLIKKKTNTFGVRYSPDGDVKATYKKIHEHLNSNGISIEGMVAGLAIIAVPVGLTENMVNKIIDECPEKITLMSNDEDGEEA